jgi:hypothetical protein
MARLAILLMAVLLAVTAQRASAQDKKQDKAKTPEPPPLPSDVGDWSIKQLLEHYDPAESDNKVGRELEKRGKGKRFLVFGKDRTVDVKSSEFLYKELRQGFPERQWYEVGGTLYKTYRAGVAPETLLDENPLYPGEALRLDGTCQKTNRKWQGVPLLVRQVLYLAVTDSKELKIEKVADAHDILDKIKGKSAADSEEWLKERYPQAYRAYEEKKERNQLPTLKMSSDKLKSGQNQSSASPTKGIWLIKYSSGVLRTYLIDENRKVLFPSVGLAQGGLIEKDGYFTLQFGDGKLERIRFQGNTLHLEHFDPADRYPDRPTLTEQGQKADLPDLNLESGPDNGEYAKFQGSWTVTNALKLSRNPFRK